LCYLKVIFGDMCRSPNLNYTSFTDPKEPAPVTVQETTPSLPYYCKEDAKQYVKQLFIAEPNFITKYAQFTGTTEGGKRIPPTYTENESSQIFKVFFLETSYIMFSVTSILQSIPDWLIILIHPIIWMVTFMGMSIFTWLISSYNIFMYFLRPGGVFARWYIGWLAGFIAWFVFMCLWGAVTVPVGVMSGFGQLLMLLSKQQVRVLNPLVAEGGLLQNPPNDTQYKPYSFAKYFVDMVKTSPIIHLLLLYTCYSIVENITKLVSVPFSKQFTYAFLAIIVLLLIWYKGRFTFIPQVKLNDQGWTSHVDPINIPEKIKAVQGMVVTAEYLQNMLNKGMNFFQGKPIQDVLSDMASKAQSKVASVASSLFDNLSSNTPTQPETDNINQPDTSSLINSESSENLPTADNTSYTPPDILPDNTSYTPPDILPDNTTDNTTSSTENTPSTPVQ
jgi:hypothetical protein